MANPAPDGARPTCHIRCGADIHADLRRAGFVAPFIEFSDPFCIGPLALCADLAALRGYYLSSHLGLAPDALQDKLHTQYAALTAIAPETRVVLWLEHDSYDQLILAYLLNRLSTRQDVDVELICIDRYPGIDRFIGLGQLDAVALASLWPRRQTVTIEQFALARGVWPALCADDPRTLTPYLAPSPALPFMGAALTRHLQELPWLRDGLSLTQRVALTALAEGERTAARLFGDATRIEPLPFLGDQMFFAALRDLANADEPALHLSEDGKVAITPTGRALLAGEYDWMRCAPRERWVGGVRVHPDGALWRWSPELNLPTLP
ncbi:MAG: DUF1835 domain-containing protein [Rhodocyclaceae bacterium]